MGMAAGQTHAPSAMGRSMKSESLLHAPWGSWGLGPVRDLAVEGDAFAAGRVEPFLLPRDHSISFGAMVGLPGQRIARLVVAEMAQASRGYLSDRLHVSRQWR